MATSPLSNWSLALDKCRDTFANLSAFRDWCTPSGQSQVSVAVAKTHTHIETVLGSKIIHPLLVIIPTGGWYSFETVDYFGGSADLLFQMKNVETNPNPDQFYAMTNPVGLIVEELASVANRENTVGFVDNPRVQLIHAPRWGSEAEQVVEKSIMFCKWSLTWGHSR